MLADTLLWLHHSLLSAFPVVWRAIVSVLCLTFILLFTVVVRKRLRQAGLRKIPGPPSASLISGNLPQMFNPRADVFHKHLKDTYGRIIRITGFLGASVLVIADTHAAARILVKEQDSFPLAPGILESNRLVWGPSLFGTTGAHHIKQRKLLNPFFAPKHIHSLTPLFQRITRQLELVLRQLTVDGPQEIQLLDWLSRLALELIAQGGLGETFDSLNPHGEEHEFAAALHGYIPAISSLQFFRRHVHLLPRWPRFLRFCMQLLPSTRARNMTWVSDTLYRCSVKIYEDKRELLEMGDEEFEHQLSEGKDIISLLMRENKDASEEGRLPDEEIVGQIGTFLFAGADTTSATLSRIFSLLAEHPDVQDRLREEINEAHAASVDGDLTYDVLSELPYLEAVCRETLRVFAPVVFASRTCERDAIIPLSRPIQTPDGPISSILVPRGTDVLVDTLAINRDKDIWGGDAEEWKPERFLSPLPGSVTEALIPGVYGNTMTFLGGGRACIGFKFAELEMKVVLSHLVRSFRFSPSRTEIVWRFSGIITPSLRESDSLGPKMPMVVERI
ncbi:cytochrome P450 [Artomyces pyxidatus]|uniref:Cytochrome P450 n=1 Tax=Artomyces pyxidatus TaxID=48021 RepID=A0ACB8STV4_9AGAM|nr:cytochrome P450 [Artomyces pyxidatus]